MTTTINASNTGSGGLIQTADASGILALQTAGTTAITINASQNVGIGTTSPGEIFSIYKSSGDPAFQNQSSAGSIFVVNRSATSAMDLLNSMNGPMTFGTNNSERMRIDSGGNVGIGTASPGAKLDVTNGGIQITTVGYNLSILGGSSGTLGGVLIRSVPRITVDNGTFENTYIGCGATVGSIIFQQGSSTTTSSNTERMRIDSTGRVGIGTSSPNTGAQTTIKAAGTSTYQVQLEQSNVTDGYGLRCSAADGDFTLNRYASSAYTETLRVTTGGNLKLSAAGTKILNSSGNPILQQTGSILQVVQSVYSTAQSTTSTSYVTTNASASITPTSATSKILVQVSVSCGNGTNQWHYLTIYRGGTNIAGGSGNPGGYLNNNSGDYLTTINFQILDSPATTSSVTYTLYNKAGSGNNVRTQVDTMPTYITLMEIAA